MAVFTYTAKDRGTLTATHSAETEYSIEIPLEVWQPSTKKDQVITRSLSNVKFGLLHSLKRTFKFATSPTGVQSEIEQLVEMFDSVANNELFEIDPYGTIASPGTAITVTMDGDYAQPRSNQTEFSFSGRVEVE